MIKSQDKIFSIYRSSAGSGKTRTLAKEFLKLALRYKSDYFKHVLAVTFTNKASQEMKDRIIRYLDREVNDQVDVTQPLAWFEIFPPTPYSVGFRRDEQRRRFDEGLRLLRESGEYQRIKQRYLTD